jgi:hypothetical protein
MSERAIVVPCPACDARLWWGMSPPPDNGAESIHVGIDYPPKLDEKCPRCGSDVDTRAHFPFVDGIPLTFDQVRTYYGSFVAKWQYHGAFPDEHWSRYLQTSTIEALLESLNTNEGQESYRQGMFYRSSAAFYRSLQLFCAFITLERRHYKTWAEVSAYYSRFFFIQAFLNLIGISWFKNALVFWDGAQVRRIPAKQLHGPPKGHGSHEIWWQLMESLRRPEYPLEHIDFVLSRAYFDPAQRNRVNYQFEYIWGGFNELSWFDSGPHQLMSHFMPIGRADRDITNIDRFFEGYDPENVDVGDFMGDDAQVLWCSLRLYLSFVNALKIEQHFVRTDTIAALVEVHLKRDAPKIMQGIIRSSDEILRDGFDLERFLKELDEAVSSFWPRRG